MASNRPWWLSPRWLNPCWLAAYVRIVARAWINGLPMTERPGGICHMCQPPEALPIIQFRRHLRLFHPEVAGPIVGPDGTVDATVEDLPNAPDYPPEVPL